MAKFGGQKRLLDPRFPFSVEERGAVTDLRRELRLYTVYDSTAVRVRDRITGQTSANHISSEIDTTTVAPLYGSPTAWRFTKSTMTAPGPAYITLGDFISHAKDATTVSFWFRNNAASPTPLNSSQPMFSVTSNATTALSPAPLSKFNAYSVRNGTLGEELTFGWNTATGIEWYLTTRSSERRENLSFGYPGNGPFGGTSPNISTAFAAEMPPNILRYGEWYHVVICTSKGNSNDNTGRQNPNAEYFGKSAVYVNGNFVSTYLGYSQPGTVTKPYGSSPVERYGFSQYSQIAPAIGDKLWFPYEATLGNRHFYQFCAWDRILSDNEIRDLYLGNVGGVYGGSVTSVTAPPRKSFVTPSRTVKNVNIGFSDSRGVTSEQPFDDRRSLAGVIPSSWGSNYVLDIARTPFPFSTEKLIVMGNNPQLSASLILSEVPPLPDSVTASPYSENIDTDDMRLLDGTLAKAIVKIGVPTDYSQVSRQIAGRTDSGFAKTVTSLPTNRCSLFMSSVHKDNIPEYTRLSSPGSLPTGIAGTGFLYYSPVYKTWIEKRSRGQWIFDDDTSKKSQEYSESVNSVTFDTKPFDTTANATEFAQFLLQVPTGREKYPWDIASASFNPSGNRLLAGWFWSGSMSCQPLISGVNETLAQFTASPQLGYFLPFKEHLERAGYPTIGSPTVAFGAPFSPRYHGYDYETIKLSKYIDRPFRLKKVILRVPISMVRKNEIQETVFGGPGGAEWTKNSPARKDMDNYVFFLYRQRRHSSSVIDSPSDVSSSVRFLVASGSVCVYNSSSFGRAYYDGFSNRFGSGTPIVYQIQRGLYVTGSLNTIYNNCNTNLTDALTKTSLTRNSSPLHGPAISINAGLNDYSDGLHEFTKVDKIEVTMYPAIVQGGMLNSSLTYVTSTTGHYSSSVFYSEQRFGIAPLSQSFNMLFNRYPYTGSYLNPNNKLRYGPITTGMQNIWLGGTRQPEFVNDASNGKLSLSNITASLPYKPYFQYESGSSNDTFRNSFFKGYVTRSYSDPTFDIEVGRTGISLTGYDTDTFSSPFQIVTDGRTVHSVYSKDNRYDLPAVFQRTNLIRFQLSGTSEGAPGSPLYLMDSHTSIGTLSGSNLADLISSLTVGNTVASPNTNRQILRDYILLPTDEIILGLDAGITPAPDVAPLTAEPVPDKLNP